MTEVRQSLAFFLLPTRAWELALGALLAIVVLERGFPLSRYYSTGLFSLGLLIITLSALILNNDISYPSFWALLPTAGAVLVILSGADQRDSMLSKALAWSPIQNIGQISYSLYLVHWPLFLYFQPTFSQFSTLVTALILIAISIPAALLLYRFVEVPFRYGGLRSTQDNRRPVVIALTISCFLTVVSLALTPFVKNIPLHAGPAIQVSPPSSNQVAPKYVPSNLVPSLMKAGDDAPSIHETGCHLGYFTTDPTPCEFGDPNRPIVRIFGDSHAASWVPALQILAEEGQIYLQVNTKGSCPSVPIPITDYEECEIWRSSVMDDIQRRPPDILIISNSDRYALNDPHGDWSSTLKGLKRDLGPDISVHYIQDVPDFTENPALCLSQNLANPGDCSVPRSTSLNEDIREVIFSEFSSVFNPAEFLCDRRVCFAISGNYMAYIDSNHLSATFSEQMADPLLEQLRNSFNVIAN